MKIITELNFFFFFSYYVVSTFVAILRWRCDTVSHTVTYTTSQASSQPYTYTRTQSKNRATRQRNNFQNLLPPSIPFAPHGSGKKKQSFLRSELSSRSANQGEEITYPIALFSYTSCRRCVFVITIARHFHNL